jgi:hypothetical protein
MRRPAVEELGGGVASDGRDEGVEEQRNERNHATCECNTSGGTGAVSRSSSWRHGVVGWAREEECRAKKEDGLAHESRGITDAQI